LRLYARLPVDTFDGRRDWRWYGYASNFKNSTIPSPKVSFGLYRLILSVFQQRDKDVVRVKCGSPIYFFTSTKLGGASSFFVPVAVLSFFGLSLSKRRLRETLCRKCCQYVRTYVRRYELHTYVQTYPFSFFRNSRPLFVLRT